MSSATDEKIKDKAGTSGRNEPKSKRPNPVALEVPVSVAGARPASAQDKRELFTEDTTTVVVFPDGAVIQLSAAIAVGQLLFLTDKRTKKEVVCQVVHKRSHRPTTCYVELEFTEDVKNFWGVTFTDRDEAEERPLTAEAVEAEEVTEDDRSDPPAAPKTEDVAQLKGEVEALRAQLRELQEKQAKEQTKDEKPAATGADAQARRLAEAELAARAAAESEAKERAQEIDRKARENATRLAEEARRKLAQAQSQAQEQAQSPAATQAQNPGPAEEDEGKRRLAEAELAARAAAEAEAAARAAAEVEARQKSWAQDEEAQKASEEAKKWEQESIENERKRRQEEKERIERKEAEGAQTESQKAEPEKEEQPQVPSLPAPVPEPAPIPIPKIGMRLPSAAPLAPPETQIAKAQVAPAAASPDKEGIDPLEELLPKPALDFTKAPKGLDPNDPYNIYKPMRKKAGLVEIAVAAVLVVVLVGGGGFAWYKNKLPFFHRGPKEEVAAKSAPAKPVVSAALNATAATPPANGTAAPVGPSGQPADNGAVSATANGTNGSPAASESAPETPAIAKNDAGAAAPEVKASEKKGPASKTSAKKESPAKATTSKGGKNHGKAETSSESKPKADETAVADDAPVIAAKLLHSAPPVYPPDAMLNYITGDVRIEAVVDATGHVGAMQVLVGPAQLRQAAMDALKQYEYAPAMQGGKAVESKVTVTIKFWFDP